MNTCSVCVLSVTSESHYVRLTSAGNRVGDGNGLQLHGCVPVCVCVSVFVGLACLFGAVNNHLHI